MPVVAVNADMEGRRGQHRLGPPLQPTKAQDPARAHGFQGSDRAPARRGRHSGRPDDESADAGSRLRGPHPPGAAAIVRAKGLLRAGTLSLSEVALACGFIDQSHFTRVFPGHERQTQGRRRRLCRS